MNKIIIFYLIGVFGFPAYGADPVGDFQETQARKDRLGAMMRQRMQENNVPINFYGKIVDQYGTPVSGVEVRASIRLVKEPLPGMIGDGFDEPVAVTAADGTFSFLNKTGEFLSIERMEKEGYFVNWKVHNKTYYYYHLSADKRHQPNPATPVLFRIWKLAGAESLKVIKSAFGLIADGRSYGLDLLTGEKTKQGAVADLRVSMVAPAVVGVREKYGWSFTFEAVDGGIIESVDDYMFLAPADGYVPRIEVYFAPGGATWSGQFQKSFYLKSRAGGVYMRIDVFVKRAYDGRGVLELESYANPNSSRNLEYEPNK